MAARVAAALAELHGSALGNHAAAHGWLQRGRAPARRRGPVRRAGYLDLAFVACEADDVERARGGRRATPWRSPSSSATPSLEVRALADSGYALVSQGRTAEGFARLDEAMAALSAGEVTDVKLAGTSFCAMLSACDQAGSLRRAEEWTRLANELLLDRLGGRPKVLHTHCRLAYGSVLCGIGRWSRGRAGAPGGDRPRRRSRLHRADAALRLAHLRVLQGRVDEAAELRRAVRGPRRAPPSPSG